tara:strand:+ start:8419 stop:10131 length:1713 start_codon:yes stop_codon:yes gene_type:complete
MRHFLNDIEISPRNRDAIGIVSEFVNEVDQLKLTTDKVVLPNEAKQIVLNHIESVGLFEAIPYRIELNNVAIEYYADLLNDLSVRDHEVSVSLTKRKSQDDFVEKALGTSFDLMVSEGVVFNTFNVPYFVIQDDQISKGITLGIAIYIMTLETIRQAQEIQQAITELIQAVTPSSGAGVVIDWGAVIQLALNVVFRIIMFALLVVALLKLATQLFVLCFPPKRNLLATKFQELLTKGCEYLGYQFESTIFQDQPNWTLLPVPLIKERKSIYNFLPDEFFAPFNKGYPSTSDSVSTLGQFINALKIMFNAKLFVKGNVIRLERRDYLYNLSTLNIQPSLVLQPDQSDQYSYNTDEVWKRYYIRYSLDSTDTHSLDEVYDYHDAEYSTEPLNAINEDLISIKGLSQVDIPFCLGARKAKLNWFELLAKEFFQGLDTVIGLFGGSSNYADIIGQRKDALMISQEHFTITKALYTTAGKQFSDYTDYVSATALWNNYHYINSITLNAYELREKVRVRIKDTDFVNLLENNYVEIQGQICEIIEVTHIDETHKSVISYRFPSDYATGKVQIKKIN